MIDKSRGLLYDTGKIHILSECGSGGIFMDFTLRKWEKNDAQSIAGYADNIKIALRKH